MAKVYSFCTGEMVLDTGDGPFRPLPEHIVGSHGPCTDLIQELLISSIEQAQAELCLGGLSQSEVDFLNHYIARVFKRIESMNDTTFENAG